MCRNNVFVLEIPMDSLKDESKKVFERMMGITKGNSYSIYQEEEFAEIKRNVENHIKIKALVRKSNSFLCEKYNIWIEEKKIEHTIPFKNFPQLVQDVYVFLVSIELEKNTESVMEQLLYHAWESAYLEVAREWIRHWILDREKCFVSVSLSPGFYGIPMDSIETFYSMVNGEIIDVFLQKGALVPQQSVLGMYCVMKQEISLFYKQCDTCLAKGKHCEFCMDTGVAIKDTKLKGETT